MALLFTHETVFTAFVSAVKQRVKGDRLLVSTNVLYKYWMNDDLGE